MVGNIKTASLVEMSIGTAIGAITFTGSIVAFVKLQGLVSGAPLVFPGQHILNALIGIGLIGLTVWFCMTESYSAYWLLVAIAFAIGFLMICTDRRRRYAGRDLDAQFVLRLGGLWDWDFTLANTLLIITGALVGSSGAILSYVHVQRNEPIILQRDPRWVLAATAMRRHW